MTYVIDTLRIWEPKVTIAMMCNPPLNRRPGQEYEDSNKTMIDIIVEVARRAHTGNAKLLIMGGFNHKETNLKSLEPYGGL